MNPNNNTTDENNLIRCSVSFPCCTRSESSVTAAMNEARYKKYKTIRKIYRDLANFLHLKLIIASMAGSPNISYRPSRTALANGEKYLRHPSTLRNPRRDSGGSRYRVKFGKGTEHTLYRWQSFYSVVNEKLMLKIS